MAAGVRKMSAFGRMEDGREVERYELDAGHDVRVEILTLGATLQRLEVPDRNGSVANVLLSAADVATILGRTSAYMGSIIGRVANRIGYAKFTLDGRTYPLAANDPPHSLHGGAVGYDKRIWNATPIDSPDSPALKLTLVDPDGAEGYPGTVNVAVTYTLTHDGTLRLDYEATTDKATPINLTNHVYFNLKDAGATTILDHHAKIFAQSYTPSDAALIPTGKIAPVAGTPVDFREMRPVGKTFDQLHNQPKGIDDNFCIDGAVSGGNMLRPAAEIYEPITGRTISVFTTEPGIQFYTGNFLDGAVTGPDGFAYQQHTGFCLETQHYPDSPNQPTFPSIILRPGKVYRQTTEYRFGTR